MADTPNVNVTIVYVDAQTAALHGINEADLRRARLAIEWSGPYGTRGRIPLATLSPATAVQGVRVSLDDLLTAMSPSFRAGDANAEPYLLVIGPSGTTAAISSKPLTLPEKIQELLRVPRQGSASRPDQQQTDHGGGRIVRLGMVDSSVTLDIGATSGLSDPDPAVKLTSTMNEPVNHDKARLGILELKCESAGYHRYTYEASGADGQSRGMVHLLVLPPYLAWILGATLLALGVLGVAIPAILATLAAADIPVNLAAGTQQPACLDGKVRYPATFGRFTLTSPPIAKGKIKIEVPARKGVACDRQVMVTADADVEPDSYHAEYSVGTGYLERRGKFNIQVGPTTSIEVRNSKEKCLENGQSVVINLEALATLKIKDPVLEPVSVEVRAANGLSTRSVGQPRPFRLEVTAESNFTGDATFEYRFKAGSTVSKFATVTIPIAGSCSAAAPPPPGPKSSVLPPKNSPLPPSAPALANTPPGAGPAIVPTTGGIVLPLSGLTFSRMRDGPLPKIEITQKPQHADAAIVVGQFIYVGARRAGTTGRDSLKYRLRHNGVTIEEEIELLYEQVCANPFADETLFYLPAGRYFLPPVSDANLPRGAREEVAKLFVAGSPGFQQNFAAELEGVRLDRPICIQMTEQSPTAPMEQQVRASLSPRDFDDWKTNMRTDRLTATNSLRWISFQLAEKIAAFKSRGHPSYRIPQAPQWLAGLVAAIDLGDYSTGGTRPFVLFRHSYLQGVHEWVDTQIGIRPDMRYLLGPSELEKTRWLAYEDITQRRGIYGVRLVREP